MKARGRAFSTFSRSLPARVTLPLAAMVTVWLSAWASAGLAWEIPDLDTIRRWIRRIVELIVLGGIGLAVAMSLGFIGAWVLSFLRQPAVLEEGEEPRPGWISHAALWSSFIPVGLTLVAALGLFIPVLKPLMLKLFAYAAVGSGVSWLVCIAALIVGGGKQELARIRRGLLLAGTPFYCLAVWLSRFL
jgi:hypothetical protein